MKENKMEIMIMGYMGTPMRVHSFIPSSRQVSFSICITIIVKVIVIMIIIVTSIEVVIVGMKIW